MSLTGNLSFRRVYTLKAQTPILHFQYSQHGATLRATEVKPKLDRFIQSRAKDRIKPEWYIKEGESALNYKLRLEAVGKQEDVTPPGDNKEYDIYYGNMSSKEKKDKAVIKHLIKGDVRMTVLCTIPELSQIIDEFIAEFFAVTNFGTMQNKGFGSYIVDEKVTWYTPDNIRNALKTSSGAAACYSFSVKDRKVFKVIKVIYSIMKSGYQNQPSLLYAYLYDNKKIDNEKSYLKEIDFPDYAIEHEESPYYPYFVRILLGLGDCIAVKGKKVKIVSAPEGLDLEDEELVIPRDLPNPKEFPIQRLASPVFFKVIGDMVYFVANRIEAKEIGGKTFLFYLDDDTDDVESVYLRVPSEKILSSNLIDNFMAYCVGKLNGQPGQRNSILYRFRETRGIYIEKKG